MRGGRGLKRQPRDYYKMLYADTALTAKSRRRAAAMLSSAATKCLFATDAPFDAEQGRGLIANTIAASTRWSCRSTRPRQIFAGNARALIEAL